MMFEKLRSGETKQKINSNLVRTLKTLRLVDVEKTPVPPEAYYAIIDGRPWEFKPADTHVARCAEKPELSAIVYAPTDENGKITADGACIYDQPDVMEDLEAQGFDVVDEDLATAEENYHVFHARGNEQARLN